MTDERILESLHELYVKDDLVPLIGAGFSKPFGLPEWDELLSEILATATLEEGYRLACELDLGKRQYFNLNYSRHNSINC